ncbi:hypothetical protein [Variovorax sp. KBW07]|uniref:hypothetical protein n=1 Tax=Variovorax sp. KBW07 TaxID=2153358 RepID=UPI000F578062|nr:hypothetical protein [Variovorax sp. KBW07]
MRHSLLRYLAGQSLPATVAGASGVAVVQALVQDGHLKATLPSIRSGTSAMQPPAVTVTEFTRLGLRELRRAHTATPLQ